MVSAAGIAARHSGSAESSASAASESVERSTGVSPPGAPSSGGAPGVRGVFAPLRSGLVLPAAFFTAGPGTGFACHRSGFRFVSAKRIASRSGATVRRVTTSLLSRRPPSGSGSYVRLTSCIV
ncbi:hypothetical protein DWW78_06475 [Alistipes indistinctus]|nr:hypothetical protein DWW78_06475 [Alistipes indistinctus]